MLCVVIERTVLERKEMTTLTRKEYLPHAENFVVRQVGKNQSRFACPVCHTPAYKEHELDVRMSVPVSCANNNCYAGKNRTKFHFYNAATVLRPGYYKIARNMKKMQSMNWYHISCIPPDKMEFNTGLDMHIGQIDTIRAYHDVSSPRWENGFYLYCVRFAPGKVLHHEIIRDENHWDEVNKMLRNGFDEQGNAVDAYAYVNRWEALGSISIISRRDALEIVDVQENIDLETIHLPF